MLFKKKVINSGNEFSGYRAVKFYYGNMAGNTYFEAEFTKGEVSYISENIGKDRVFSIAMDGVKYFSINLKFYSNVRFFEDTNEAREK